MLCAEKLAWIQILRPVAEEIECHHHDRGENHQTRVLAQHRPDTDLALFLGTGQPVRTFGHRAPDIEYEQRGNHTHHEHATPSKPWQGEVKHGSKQVTAGIASLQKPRNRASPFRWYALHCQRS